MKAKFDNFRHGFRGLNYYLFFNNAYDWVRGTVTAHNFHVDLEFATADCDLQMNEVNYTPNKWAQLIRNYLNVDELELLCQRLLHYQSKGGIHKKYIPDIGMNFKARTNTSGACLMAITVGFNEKDGWHCEVFSRASELTIRWFMDLIFIHVIVRNIGSRLGFTSHDCKVYWHMVSTYQSITSMPLVLVLLGKEDWLIEGSKDIANPQLTIWQVGTIKRYLKSFVGGDYMNFRVQRRPAEMYRILKGEMAGKKYILTEDLAIPESLAEPITFDEEDFEDEW